MPAYGLAHILWLLAIGGTAAALSLLCRAKRLPHRAVRAALAFTLAAVEIERTLRDGLHFPHQMPFNLCNVSTWALVFALLTLRPLAVEFAYFVGLSGAAMALLTPDHWPVRFFLNHGGTVVAATVLVFGRVGRVRRGAVWRSLGLLGIYGLLLGAFNWAFGTNYGYLCRKPQGLTLMTWMGPWPVYLLWAALAALGLFWLLWLPLRRDAS